MLVSMLTTKDNPYDPFDEYPAWFAFDTRKGYNTPNYLARIVVTSDALSEADQALAEDQAIDEIIEFDPFGRYKKVTREVDSISLRVL